MLSTDCEEGTNLVIYRNVKRRRTMSAFRTSCNYLEFRIPYQESYECVSERAENISLRGYCHLNKPVLVLCTFIGYTD